MKDNRIGEMNINNQNLNMWIKEYRRSDNIDVEFEDGYIARNRTYSAFKNGLINNRNFKRPQNKKIIDNKGRIGEISYNTFGTKMTIINYIKSNNVIVEFDNGWKTKCTYCHFKIGDVFNPYDKTVYGVGYLGEGEYKCNDENGKLSKRYITWYDMIKRCHDENYKQKHPTYIECSICDEWFNFQTFAKWYDENYYEVDNEKMCLDKDILHKGNKIYSPDHCIFVPYKISTLFVQRTMHRGKYLIGVSYQKRDYTYMARLSKMDEGVIYLGSFNNEIEAFYTYKKEKEKHIREVAEKYKNKIPEKLFDAMYKWKVNITD